MTVFDECVIVPEIVCAVPSACRMEEVSRPGAQPLFHTAAAGTAPSSAFGCAALRRLRSAFSARSQPSTSCSRRPSCSSGKFAAGANSCSGTRHRR